MEYYDSSYALRIGWKNGLKNVQDEKSYMCSKSNLEHDDSFPRKSLMNKVYGFIPDNWFAYPSFMPRKDMQNRSTKYRNKNEYSVACDYVKDIKIKVKVKDLAEACEYYDAIFVQLFLLEVLTRNRNVDIVFDDDILVSIFDILKSNGIITDGSEYGNLYHEIIYYATKGDACECIVDDDNKENILLFNPNQTLHPTTTYPIV